MTTGFCIICGHHLDSFDGLKECPNCGTEATPCRDQDQVTVSVNWFELMIALTWAERWAHEKDLGAGTIYSIAERLMKQHPEKADMPLTLAGQINQLRDEGHDVETNIKGMDDR